MNVLVTGGAGFIGSHVVDAMLAQSHTVTVVDDFNDFYDPVLKRRNIAGFGNQTRVIEADIRDPASLRPVFEQGRFEAVLHFAARAGVRASITRPGSTQRSTSLAPRTCWNWRASLA